MKAKIFKTPLFDALCAACIVLFALTALVDCLARHNAGGETGPGTGLILFTLFVELLLACQAVRYWRAKGEYGRELGVVLLTLLPEPWIWYLFQHSFGSTLFFYCNVPLWAFLCAGITLSSGGVKNGWILLTLFFVKGFCMLMAGNGFGRSPWMFGHERSTSTLKLLAAPIYFVTYYQLLTLAFMWHFREKAKRKAKTPPENER